MQQNYFEWSFKTYLKIVLLSLSGTCTNRPSSHFYWTLGRNISSHVIVIYIVTVTVKNCYTVTVSQTSLHFRFYSYFVISSIVILTC